MGCICSKEASVDEYVDYNEREKEKEKELNKDSVQLVAPSTGEEFVMGPGGGGGHGRTGGSVHPISKSALQGNVGSAPIHATEGEKKTMTVDRPTKASHQRRLTLDMENNVGPSPMSGIVSMPNGAKGEQIVAGWPSWLSSVAGEAIQGRGVLHRDIKGSNLLIDNKGVLKIGDFGLASFRSDPSQPLTSRVVTLWYRPPELLLGATKYGASVDLWSTGCIIAELFSGSPIMPGSTEVEQIHKIFKLCGSPSEEYWRKSKLAHASSFKPQHPYKRRLAETFRNFPSSALAIVDVLLSVEPDARGTAASALKSEFFTTKPLPCDPSSLPKYVPSKEYDAKLRNEEARRQRAEAVKGRGAESVRRGSRQSKDVPTPEFKPQAQVSSQGQTNTKCISEKYKPGEDSGSGFRMEPHRGTVPNGLSHSTLMINQNAVGSSQKKVEDEAQLGYGHTFDSSRNNGELRTHGSHMPHGAAGVSSSSHRKDERISGKESVTGYASKKTRMHYSGPLMPPGGNIEEMLKDHERQIQEAVRKARIDKTQQKL
ncbi:hypothetical protein PVL29_024919 [Vitis rotundifolia]|uniref:Protein kinase domain-containing protein n=1 Tax=Vitis rotundifolia TaxID=103349 RepID=A0AA38YT22_VITRO|nr:hypothetical protein PVL29_024919 [Vitis rotundifolia]